MQSFRILPILGRKTDVPADDPTMFKSIGEGSYMTHDAGGTNTTLQKKRNTCSKSDGYSVWSTTATDQATSCLGMFELYDGTNRDHIMFDNGRFYVFDTTSPYEARLNFDAGTDAFTVGDTVTDGTTNSTAVIYKVTVTAGAWATNNAAGYLHIHTIDGDFDDGNTITDVAGGSATVNEASNLEVIDFATSDNDLYDTHRIGAYMVFTDRGEHEPYKWTNDDDYVSKLIASGTAYKFRWLMPYQRRVVGLYSDQTNGNIDVRYSTDWPTTGITSLNFPALNQLWIPNDDPIVGGKTMGYDKGYIYCENSIQQLVHYPSYDIPFRIFTVVPQQGAVSHHSIVNLGDRHLMFNRNYGFCSYSGGRRFPDGGVPISQNIEKDMQDIISDYYDLIIGKAIPFTNKVVWSVPVGDSTCNRFFFYDLITGQWTIEEKEFRFFDIWKTYESFTWTNLSALYTKWEDIPVGVKWADYTHAGQKFVYANTDGYVYYDGSNSLGSDAEFPAFRIEPIMDFGNPRRFDHIKEIWFNLGTSSSPSIDVYHRSGNTVGELEATGWTQLDSVSMNSPYEAVVYTSKNARLHQIKWGTNLKDEPFEVREIVLKYTSGSER